MAIPHFIYSFFIGWTYELFLLLAFINNAAMNIHVLVLLFEHLFSISLGNPIFLIIALLQLFEMRLIPMATTMRPGVQRGSESIC